MFNCEKADALRRTLEFMKAAGLVNTYSRDISRHEVDRATLVARSVMISRGLLKQQIDEGVSPQLFIEAAFLFMYCMSLSLVAATVLEPTMVLLAVKWYISKMRAFILCLKSKPSVAAGKQCSSLVKTPLQPSVATPSSSGHTNVESQGEMAA